MKKLLLALGFVGVIALSVFAFEIINNARFSGTVNVGLLQEGDELVVSINYATHGSTQAYTAVLSSYTVPAGQSINPCLIYAEGTYQ